MAKKGKIYINREFCKGCRLCINACPVKILELDSVPNGSGSYPCRLTAPEKCIACGNCYEMCPDVCIEIFELEQS